MTNNSKINVDVKATASATVDVSDSVNNAIENLTDEPTKFLGKTGTSVLSICFGGINYYAERLDMKRRIKLENWKQNTFNLLNEIPEQNRQDAPLEIAGPLTEASKFYFENEELSTLFSNLLTSSCDTRFISKVHQCFIESIK